MRSGDRDHSGQHGDTPSLLKVQKISWAWWRVPVIPATQEAEAGELPEPRRWTLPDTVPLYSSLGDRVRLCLKKNKNKKRSRTSQKTVKNELSKINENKLLVKY